MIKYFCDKCGKELSSDVFEVEVKPPEIRTWLDEAEAGTYILCYDCTRKLNKWIKTSEKAEAASTLASMALGFSLGCDMAEKQEEDNDI